mmetsp:Transcript_33781/g.61253  ORF Transcript_33781/g.61253 Transcript_33781/m.61253 type:complete len:627 (+) Transcript_33781:61-1941(+)
MASAAEASAGVKLGVEEAEPDDDFRVEEPEKAKSLKASKEADTEEAAPEPSELPVELTGDWQQLEGVARPPGAGPRLLAWNACGHVATYPKQLRVEVHPSADEKPVRVADYDGLQMASISPGGTCFAAGSKSTGGPRLLLRPAERWEKAVFSASLVGDEAPEAVACGVDFVAVLTSRRMLRLYTFSGMPIGLLSVSGRSVALAARQTLLLVVTRSLLAATPADSDDVLDFRILESQTRAEVAAGRLPLSPGSRLRWIGFSEDLVPVAIDTAGAVRALLGSGAGSWGPQSGRGAEWTPVLSLAQHEAELGPLWAVKAEQAAITFAEVGLHAQEPQPRISQEDSSRTDSEATTGSQEGSGVWFGVRSSCQLRTIPWNLPLGAFPTAGDSIQTAFREQLLSRHMQDMAAMGLLPSEISDSFEKRSRSSPLKLFAQLATAGEVERAHHVAQFILSSMSASSKLLDNAQKLSEKAHQYKLADAVASLPVKEAQVKGPAVRQVSSEVPMAARSVTAPLFAPGEFEEQQDKPSAASQPTGSKEEDSQESLQAASGTAQTSGQTEAAAPLAPEAAAPVAPPLPAAANPFARKRPGTGSRPQAPHLLRDALGGSSRPATPMGSPASGRPAKLARI